MSSSDSRETVIEMVQAQRGMMWLFVAKLGFDFSSGAANELLVEPVRIVFWVAYLVVSGTVAYFVFRLASAIYGAGPGIICACLTVAPCLGSLTVLILNGNTMDRLRKAGVKVGMLGASAQQLRELTSVPESNERTTPSNEIG